MLSFLFKDFLLFPGGVESRDNICIIENHLIDRNTTCIYQAKSHLFTAKVLRDRPPPPPHHFLTESLGTHALIYLCLHSFIHSFMRLGKTVPWKNLIHFIRRRIVDFYQVALEALN